MGRGKKENADVAKATKPVGKSATSFIAGSTAGLVSSGLLQPLEVVKTRMQAHRLKAGFSINKSVVGVPARLLLIKSKMLGHRHDTF